MSEYSMKLPDVGEGVAQAEIVEWHVAVGDTITEDDVIADVMSDKATIELPSPVTGVVSWLAGDVGDVLAVGSVLLRIDVVGVDDGDGSTVADSATGREPAAEPEAGPGDEPTTDDAQPDVVPGDASLTEDGAGDATTTATPGWPGPPTEAPGDQTTMRPPARSDGVAPAADGGSALAAPAVRARASDCGVDLGAVVGTGPDGRITHADIDGVLMQRAGSHRSATAPASRADRVDEEIRVIGLRRNIAERVQESARRIPHFTYVDEVDVTELERLRRELNGQWSGQRPKLSLLPFLMRAMILAIDTHPEMNARFDDEGGVVRRSAAVHLGIATQTDRGLMVPVVKHAESLDLWASASAVSRLADEARSATISLDELTGSTITITSLGALGGIVTTPVINMPEVAIVGVNKITDRPVYEGDTLVRRSMMNLSSSFDHRVIDGADAAEFIQEIKRTLEHPALLFTP
ncbi:MAG: dihydrolipoamide acetyltransferase family protein [Ilumatobacteraceae bacterium]